MTTTALLILYLFLVFIGVNLMANNRFNQFIISNMFYSSTMSSMLVRLLGVAVLGALVLFLMKLWDYGILALIFTSMIFAFLTLQGRAKAKRVKERKQQELNMIHKARVEERKKDLVIKRAKKIKELENSRNKPQSVSERKKAMWDDGSMTNRDIIRDLNK